MAIEHYSGTCRRKEGGRLIKKAQKSRRLLQMSVKGSGRLLQGSDRQGLGRAQRKVVGVTPSRPSHPSHLGGRLGRAQRKVVGVTADGPMSAPGGPGQALDLAMSGQTTRFSHKAKRREGRQPGKPCRGIWLKGEQTVRGTDHHVGPLDPKFNER